jgi:DNA polymerase III subunit gamma/tau
MIEPATPVGLSRGMLTLRYGRRHASFHAVQARSGELDQALRQAIEQACGLRVRIDVKVEGEDERRRPVPPSVTPADARTPVLDDRAASTSVQRDEPSAAPADDGSATSPTSDEGTEVREAEHGGTGAQVDVDALLASELDAQLLEERPPPGTAG